MLAMRHVLQSHLQEESSLDVVGVVPLTIIHRLGKEALVYHLSQALNILRIAFQKVSSKYDVWVQTLGQVSKDAFIFILEIGQQRVEVHHCLRAWLAFLYQGVHTEYQIIIEID